MGERARLLIVDDELGPRESLRLILKPFYDVFTVSDGAAALEFLQEESVDLMTLDLKMRGMSGLEVLEEVRRSNSDVMVVIVTGYGTFKSVVEAIRLNVFDYISKPFNISEVLSVIRRCLETKETTSALKELFGEIASLARGRPSSSQWSRILEKTTRLLGASTELPADPGNTDFLGVIKTICDCLEARNPFMVGHSKRVKDHVDLMARQLGLPRSLRNDLRVASYLHDIGKVTLSDRFINGSGKLSSADWAILKTHPLQSVGLVAPLSLSTRVVSSIRHHHERFDGTGYPDGLSGADIPLGARLIGIANTYDALLSPRPYRKAMSPRQAVVEIKRQAATSLDPDLIRAFLAVCHGTMGSPRLGRIEEPLHREIP